MASRSWGAAIALTLLAAAAACGTADQSGPGEVAADQPPVWVDPACTAEQLDPMKLMQATRGGIPTDFVATAVQQCRTEDRDIVGQGTFTMLLTQRADSGVTELVAELRRPSDPARTEVVCDASYVMPPYFFLLDASGRALLPAVPTDACGKPRLEVREMLQSLPYRTVAEARLGPARKPDAAVPGCSDAYKDMIVIGSTPPGPARPLWPDRAGDIHACVYDVVPAGGDVPTGRASSGHPITGAAAAALRAGLDAAGPAADCTAEHTRFAVLTVGGKGNSATVELDGCLRLLRPDHTLGQLDAATVALITAG